MSVPITTLREFDLLNIKPRANRYYYCTDSGSLYRYQRSDDPTSRVAIAFIRVLNNIDRLYNIRPSTGKYYYVLDTNTLWLYDNNWKLIAGTNPSAAYYPTEGDIHGVGGGALDNNGLLGDGSVVVRDNNRIIKGRSYVDALENKIVLTTYLGNGIHIKPNDSDKGSLILNADGSCTIKGDIIMEGDLYTRINTIVPPSIENIFDPSKKRITTIKYHDLSTNPLETHMLKIVFITSEVTVLEHIVTLPNDTYYTKDNLELLSSSETSEYLEFIFTDSSNIKIYKTDPYRSVIDYGDDSDEININSTETILEETKKYILPDE